MAGVHAPAFVPGALAATTMQVTTVFSCGHRYLNLVDISLDQSELEMKVGACNKDECQARPLADVLGQRVTLDKQVKNFIKHMDQTLFTAGMQAEGALRVLSNAEPMLPMEMEAVSATPDMVQAFLGCLGPTRTVAAAMYTGHRGALAMLQQYRLCFQTGTSQWQAEELMHALYNKNNTIQQKLGALANVQSTLCANSWEAPLAHFTGAYSLATVEPYWGEQQLQALRDSNGGKAILALPLTRENILTAKQHIQDWKTQYITFFARERAAYYRDYPGVEQLRAAGKLKTTEQIMAEIGDDSNMANHFTGFMDYPSVEQLRAAGKLKTTEQILAEIGDDSNMVNNFTGFMIKPQHNRDSDDSSSPVFIGVDNGLEHNKTGAFVRAPGRDIRELRTERIGCKAMARNTLTIDLGKALKCPKSD